MKKILITIILLSLIFTLIGLFKPYYHIEDRIDNINKFSMDTTKNTPLGWLKVQNTNIDFPIMYYDDVAEELDDVNQELGWNYNDQRKIENRTVILSHNVLNVSSHPLISNKNHKRFEQLMSFIYYNFAKESKYIQYTINNKNYLFKIYGVSLQKTENLNFNNLKSENMNNYITKTKKQSYFDYDIDVNKNDKLITLITCTRFYGNKDYSFIVDARKVRKRERVNNYKVIKKNSYKGIEKILNGDDSND